MLIIASEPTCVVSEVFSVLEQVTVTEVTSDAVVEMREEAGFCSTRVSMVLILVTTSAQVVAAARDERPVLTFPVQERMQSLVVFLLPPEVVLLARLLAVVLAAVSPAELAVRALALASRSAVLEEQAEMPFRPSSSYFLH